jgi:hypothetical protein
MDSLAVRLSSVPALAPVHESIKPSFVFSITVLSVAQHPSKLFKRVDFGRRSRTLDRVSIVPFAPMPQPTHHG